MSVLIKGMEMPQKTYAHCMLIKDIDGSVQLHVCTKNSEEICEWEFYDLVPVPPHGRLIDADALAEHKFVCIAKVTINGKDSGIAYRLGWNSAIEAIMENAETIIGGE